MIAGSIGISVESTKNAHSEKPFNVELMVLAERVGS